MLSPFPTINSEPRYASLRPRHGRDAMMTRWAPVLPVRLGLPIAVNVSLVCDLNGRPGGGWNDRMT